MRLTARGRAACVLALGLWLAALVTGSTTTAAGALALTTALALGACLVPLPRVRVDRSLSVAEAHEGQHLAERIDVTLVAPRRAHVVVEERAPAALVPRGEARAALALSRGDPRTIEIAWEARSWGAHALGPLRLSLQDAFGLWERVAADEARAELVVVPRGAPLGKFAFGGSRPEPALGAHQVSKPGDGSEFFALREYQPGDSIRRINWKASARSSSTMVNQVSRDSFSRVLVIVDLRAKEWVAAEGRDPAAIRSGRAVASILAHHDRLKDHLTLILLTDDARSASLSSNARAVDLVRAMAAAAPGGHVRTSDAMDSMMTRLRPRSPVYVVSSLALDDDVAAGLRTALALGARPFVVSPAPGVDEATVVRSREEALSAARGLGIAAREWAPDVPLEVALLA